VLHPVSVLTAFLFPNVTLDIHILIYTALAAVGGALLARTLGVSPGACAVAGLAYGLSGYVLGMGSIIQYLCAAATAPWLLAGMRAAGEGRRFGVTAAATATSILYFAGDPQWAITAIILGIALAIEARINCACNRDRHCGNPVDSDDDLLSRNIPRDRPRHA
jgi:hypothetical protein